MQIERPLLSLLPYAGFDSRKAGTEGPVKPSPTATLAGPRQQTLVSRRPPQAVATAGPSAATGQDQIFQVSSPLNAVPVRKLLKLEETDLAGQGSDAAGDPGTDEVGSRSRLPVPVAAMAPSHAPASHEVISTPSSVVPGAVSSNSECERDAAAPEVASRTTLTQAAHSAAGSNRRADLAAFQPCKAASSGPS